jgi:hypothetical protein
MARCAIQVKEKNKGKEKEEEEEEDVRFIITQKYTVGCEGCKRDQVTHQSQGCTLFCLCSISDCHSDSWKVK